MKRALILMVGTLPVIVSLARTTGHVAAIGANEFCADSEELEFLTLINEYRVANGAKPLVLSQTLSAAAEHHSLDMAANNFMSHDGSDGSQPRDHLTAHGYLTGGRWGENVFAGD